MNVSTAMSLHQDHRHHHPSSPIMPPSTASCLLCYAVEDVMMNLFTPPGLDVEGRGTGGGRPIVTKMNSVCAENNSRGSSRTSKYGSCYWRDESDDDDDDDDDDESCYNSPGESETEADSATVRKVCRLWKSKRRKEKLKAKRLREEEAFSLYDKELQTAKEIALSIQRSFEKKFDENDDIQRFERYGSRAHFMKFKER